MPKPKPKAELPTRAEVYDAGRQRLAELYSYLKTGAYDHTLPLTDEDRATFKRLAARASNILADFNAQGRN